jgi:hypothetical protein
VKACSSTNTLRDSMFGWSSASALRPESFSR